MRENNKSNCKRQRENLKKDEDKLNNHRTKNNIRMQEMRKKAKIIEENNPKVMEVRRRIERMRKQTQRKKLAELKEA